MTFLCVITWLLGAGLLVAVGEGKFKVKGDATAVTSMMRWQAVAAIVGRMVGAAIVDGPAMLHMVWVASPLVMLGLAHAGEVTKGWSFSWFFEDAK